MKIVSLFSGIGGFELGIKKSNLQGEIVFSSEIDKYATKSYLANFQDNNLHGDITKIDAKDIPDFDLLIGGFPCQAFSIAGRQKGFEDTRGTLFFDVARVLKEKQPKYFLLENVKNLISHDKGNTFKTIVNTLNEIGYTIDFTVINSKEAGVPQNRERTYIVGILHGEECENKNDIRNKKLNNFKKSYDYKGFNFFNSLSYNNSLKSIIDILDIEENEKDKFVFNRVGLSDFLKSVGEVEKNKVNSIVKVFDIPKTIYKELDYRRRVYSVYGISPTLITRESPKIYIEDKKLVRRLSPKECFRIQGFEDEFFDNIKNEVSNTQLFKQIGNSVSPPVITGIINHLIEFI